MNFVIELPPITKKNSQQIIHVKGRPMIIPSKQYAQYERDALWMLNYDGEPIDYPVNVSAKFFMKTRRKVDLVNLQEALLDVLVRAEILEDDNSRIVVSMDGSRVSYDKERPRTEVEITRSEWVDKDTQTNSGEQVSQ